MRNTIISLFAVLCLSACNSLSPLQSERSTVTVQQGEPVDTPKSVWVVVEYTGNWKDKTWNPPIIIRRNFYITAPLTKNSTLLYVNPDTRFGATGTNYWTGDVISTEIISPSGESIFSYTTLTQDTTIVVVAE
jgi:hypothetical protein